MSFTVIVRLPFARGDFVDPPHVDWDPDKDRALWHLVSQSSKTSELDWQELGARFDVLPTFLVQQAAWLYERHLNHVRAQMRRVGNASGAAASTQTALGSGGVPMRRGASGGGMDKGEPVLELSPASELRQRDSPPLPAESSIAAPPLSRTPSTNTVTQSRFAPSPQARTVPPSARAPNPQRPAAVSHHAPSPPASPTASAPSSSSSSSDSEPASYQHPLQRSALFKRPPRFYPARPAFGVGGATLGATREEDADEDADSELDGSLSPTSAASLPFANLTAHRPPDTAGSASSHSSSAPYASAPASAQRSLTHKKTKSQPALAHSASSAAGPSRDTTRSSPSLASSTGSLARLAERGHAAQHRAPRGASVRSHGSSSGAATSAAGQGQGGAGGSAKGKGRRVEGSEGTPSMGSSFSDLDDASISQSALEDALLSNMQHGRFSMMSQLRSRYLRSTSTSQ